MFSGKILVNASRLKLRDYFLWAIVFAVSAAGVLLFSHNDLNSGYADYPVWLTVILSGSFLFPVTYFLFLIISARYSSLRHRSATYPEEYPGCTVIIPVCNESSQVVETLESIINPAYPEEKMQILTVNDGSTDDTLEHLRLAVEKYPSRLTLIDLPCNQGKKHALCTAIRQTEHEFIITVDSDSSVGKDTLYQLLRPFVRKEVGAVAGAIGKKTAAVAAGGIYGVFSDRKNTVQLGMILIFATLWSIIPAAVYWQHRHSLRDTVWAFICGYFAQAALSWIAVYSLFTLRNSNWLTRQRPEK